MFYTTHRFASSDWCDAPEAAELENEGLPHSLKGLKETFHVEQALCFLGATEDVPKTQPHLPFAAGQITTVSSKTTLSPALHAFLAQKVGKHAADPELGGALRHRICCFCPYGQ